MNPTWKSYLESVGAVMDEHAVAHFGDASREVEATASSDVIADLSHLSVLRFTGPDAQTFVQAQFANDARQVNENNAQPSCYCSPKGRVLANFLLWSAGGDYLIALPASLAEAIKKRLTMYVLRSKVVISNASDELVRLGIAGPNAARAVAEIAGAAPQELWQMTSGDHATALRLPGDRFLLLAPPEQATRAWSALSGRFLPVGSARWRWLDIRSGLPWITPATQEEFVPQMLNLDTLGALSFKKGCYPGQEIVARTHYLGKPKRRLYAAHVDAPAAPAPGDDLASRQADEHQTAGKVVEAQPAPSGGYDVLAVCQIESAEGGMLHLRSLDGPLLKAVTAAA